MKTFERRYAAVGADTVRLFGVDAIPVRRVGPAGGAIEAARPVAEIEGKPFDDRTPEVWARGAEESRRLLEVLRARYEADAPHQHFVTDHHSIVFGEGDPSARLMFVGEAPGAEEDKTGRPFVGRAGQLLDKMILAMGLRREDVYICNVLKTRPPGNATPTGREAELCRPYLVDQIRIIRPEAIVTLGLPASRTLLQSEDSMGRLRGRFARVRFHPHQGVLAEVSEDPEFEVPVMPTYHPAFLLRDYTPENRAKVWSDLLQVVKLLGLTPRTSPAA